MPHTLGVFELPVVSSAISYIDPVSRAEAFAHNPSVYYSASDDGSLETSSMTSVDGVEVQTVLSLPIGADWRICRRSIVDRFHNWTVDSGLRVLRTSVGMRDPATRQLLVADVLLTDCTGHDIVLACLFCTSQQHRLKRATALDFMVRMRDLCTDVYGCSDVKCVLLCFNVLGALSVLRVQ
jgi:hypothetical protein